MLLYVIKDEQGHEDVQPAWDVAQGCWFFTPLVPSIVDNLEAAYARGRGRSQQAIDFAANYDADVVFDKYWRPALDISGPVGMPSSAFI